MAEFNRPAHASRVIHFYDINFGFNDDSLPHAHFVELFKQVIVMSKKRDESRYVRSGDKRLFIQDIKFVPDIEQVHGKLRAVRLDVTPEILNMKTDTARDIEMAEGEGIVETTHFVISYKNKRKRLAVEYNAAGAKTHELGRYLENIGVKSGLQSVVIKPVMAGDSLTDFLNRVGKMSELEISAPKDSIAQVEKYNPGLASAMEASKDFFKCDTLILKPQFDIKNKAENSIAKEFVSSIIKAWKNNPLRRDDFETFKVRGQDSEKNGTLELFDLLRDDEKSKIKVEKRKKTRILNSEDMFAKIVSIMTKKAHHMNRILDCYLAYPKFWDCVAIVIVTGLLHWKAELLPLAVSDLASLQNGLIGTAVSLAGFIIAALTIIVTFRANIAVKKMDDSANGMELLFNSQNYGRIVSVFKGAILELVIGFVVVYLSILAEKALAPRHSILIAIALLIGITLSTLRCLFVLYSVLDVESSPSN